MLTVEKAVELAEFVADEIAAEPTIAGRRIIANRIMEAARKAAGMAEPESKVEFTKLPVMTDGDATRFECEPMPFGQHKGKAVRDVPLKVLTWLADQRFVDRLRSYLRRPDVVAKIEIECQDSRSDDE